MTVGYPVRAGGRVQGRADAVGSAVLSSPPPAPLWTVPGHPGICPTCGSPHVQWQWKPDLEPTQEQARCYHCGWNERRSYKTKTTLKVGQPIEIHQASCESPDQHERVTLAGEIVLVHDDGAGLAYMADGTWAELCPWFTSDCPNAVPAEQAAAA